MRGQSTSQYVNQGVISIHGEMAKVEMQSPLSPIPEASSISQLSLVGSLSLFFTLFSHSYQIFFCWPILFCMENIRGRELSLIHI